MRHEPYQRPSDTGDISPADRCDVAAFKGFYTYLYITSCKKTNQQHCHQLILYSIRKKNAMIKKKPSADMCKTDKTQASMNRVTLFCPFFARCLFRHMIFRSRICASSGANCMILHRLRLREKAACTRGACVDAPESGRVGKSNYFHTVMGGWSPFAGNGPETVLYFLYQVSLFFFA